MSVDQQHHSKLKPVSSGHSERVRVSIIIVVLNCVEYVESALKSVLDQTYSDIELIVIDGGSTDGTLDVIYRHKLRIDILVSEPDKGIYYAMNKGLNLASGELIGFVNADDFLFPWVVNTLVEKFKNLNFDYTVGPVDIVDKSDGFVRVADPLRNFIEGNRYVYRMVTAHQALFVRKKLLIKLGGFNTRYKLRADFDLLCRIIKLKGDNYFRFTESVGRFRLGGVSGGFDTFHENFYLMREHGGSFPIIILVTFASYFKVAVASLLPLSLKRFIWRHVI